MLRRLFLYCFMALSLVLHAGYTPKTVPDPKTQGQAFYVSNPDGIVNSDDVAFLNRCAQMLEKETQVELAVVALNSIDHADAFYFSYELFQRWGIGKKGKNTGVLVLFVLDSHDIRIMTGSGIEGVLTDAQCSQIIRNKMTPYFKAGDYGGGLCHGALAIYKVCTNGNAPEELLNMQSATHRKSFESERKEVGINWIALISLLAFLLLMVIVIWKTKGPNSRMGSGSSSWTGFGGGYTGGGFGGGFGGGSWGGGSTFGGGAGGKW